MAVLAPMPRARVKTAMAVKAGFLREHAGAVAQVLEQGIEPGAGADFADVFFYLLDAA